MHHSTFSVSAPYFCSHVDLKLRGQVSEYLRLTCGERAALSSWLSQGKRNRIHGIGAKEHQKCNPSSYTSEWFGCAPNEGTECSHDKYRDDPDLRSSQPFYEGCYQDYLGGPCPIHMRIYNPWEHCPVEVVWGCGSTAAVAFHSAKHPCLCKRRRTVGEMGH